MRYIKKIIRYIFIDLWLPSKGSIDLILDQEKDVFFVQIGAYDGITNDPIHDLIKNNHWGGYSWNL